MTPRVRQLVEAARGAICAATSTAIALETRHDEASSVAKLRVDFVPRISALAFSFCTALSHLLDAVDPDRDQAVAEASSSGPVARAADLAFMGRWELNAKLRQLDAVSTDDDAWTIIAWGASLRRRIVRIGTAVDGLLATALGDESSLAAHDRDELRRSLAVRRRYTELRAAIRRTAADETLGEHRRLRLVAVNLAMIVGAQIYEDLRMSDRIAFRELQRRILAWLRSARTDGTGSDAAGERLFADVLAFGELLTRVNDRAELREHDLERIRGVHARVVDHDIALDSLRTELAHVYGRDEELDRLLVALDGVDDPRLESCLQRLEIELGGGAPERVEDVEDTVELMLGSN